MKYKEDAKIGRNDPCPCGSGLKYKKCCINKEDKSVILSTSNPQDIKQMYAKKYNIQLKQPNDIEGIKKTGKLVVETLEMVKSHIRPGMATEEINFLVHEFTIKHGGSPAPLKYKGFPKSVCVSVNEVICHGIPGARILNPGDIVNVDVTTVLNGYYADASQTFFVGTPGPNARKIVHVSRECLKIGQEMIQPGNTIGHIGWAIAQYAVSQGCSVVEEYVGHGTGFHFHEAPQVPHFGHKGEGIPLVPGMVFTIEPMINLGKKQLKRLKDKWTAVTLDGSLSAQFEQTLLVTKTGFEVLTPFDLTSELT